MRTKNFQAAILSAGLLIGGTTMAYSQTTPNTTTTTAAADTGDDGFDLGWLGLLGLIGLAGLRGRKNVHDTTIRRP